MFWISSFCLFNRILKDVWLLKEETYMWTLLNRFWGSSYQTSGLAHSEDGAWPMAKWCSLEHRIAAHMTGILPVPSSNVQTEPNWSKYTQFTLFGLGHRGYLWLFVSIVTPIIPLATRSHALRSRQVLIFMQAPCIWIHELYNAFSCLHYWHVIKSYTWYFLLRSFRHPNNYKCTFKCSVEFSEYEKLRQWSKFQGLSILVSEADNRLTYFPHQGCK
jgi:hypothetical protein